MNEQEMREIVEAAFKARFGGIELVSTNVKPGVGYDGDPVVDIKIIYDSKVEQLDGEGILRVDQEVHTKFDADFEKFPAGLSCILLPGPTLGSMSRKVSKKHSTGAARAWLRLQANCQCLACSEEARAGFT